MKNSMWFQGGRVALLASALLILGLWQAPAVGADPILIRFSHVVSESAPKGMGAERFRELVEQRLGDRVRVEIFPNSERYTDEQALVALLFGEIELAAPSLAKFGRYSKKLQVFDLPFLFDDVDAVERFQSSAPGQSLLDSMEQRGIRGLAYWSNGMRVLSAKRALRDPGDLRGLTVRVEPSAIIADQYEALGAVPYRLAFARVYDALQLGLVSAQENTWSNIYSKRFFEHTPFFTETNHSYLGYMVVTSTQFWEGLPTEVRAELESVLSEVTEEVNRVARERADRDYQRVLAERGVEIIRLDLAARQRWREALRPVWARHRDDIGSDLIVAAQNPNE
jgi:C4-dicarboxylate-binding protein DctP